MHHKSDLPMVWREAFIELAWRVQGLLTCACCLHSPTAKLSSCTKKENELMKKKEKKKKRKKKGRKKKEKAGYLHSKQLSKKGTNGTVWSNLLKANQLASVPWSLPVVSSEGQPVSAQHPRMTGKPSRNCSLLSLFVMSWLSNTSLWHRCNKNLHTLLPFPPNDVYSKTTLLTVQSCVKTMPPIKGKVSPTFC